jgi:hypothetical protein
MMEGAENHCYSDFTGMAPSTRDDSSAAEKSPFRFAKYFDAYFSRLMAGSPADWNSFTLGGLAGLILIWAAIVHGTWGAWGSLSVDCGRDMYVSKILAEGKMLYRDAWYNFGPVAPYFNSYLFRWFGVNLSVLYWAGSLAALGSAIALYLAGMQLSFSLAGWAAGAVLLFEAFHPTLFSFTVPYSFAAVYGCLVACVFVWVVAKAANAKGRIWVCATGLLAMLSPLVKFEFGAACLATLALLILARAIRERSWKVLAGDLAVILPGAIFCGLVVHWMISIRGAAFLKNENFQSWPGSYFMTTYGKMWLAMTGCDFSGDSLVAAGQRILLFLAVVQGMYMLLTLRETKPARQIILVRLALSLGALCYLAVFAPRHDVLSAVFFPMDMVVYVGIAAAGAWWNFWMHRESEKGLAVALVFTFSTLAAFRVLFKMLPIDYPVFFNGPAVLAFLMLAVAMIPRLGHSRRFTVGVQVGICLACVLVAALRMQAVIQQTPRPTWLTTERGSIRGPRQTAEQYDAAIRFMKEKAAVGELTLSVPEDTSLYFFAGTPCPTRVIAYTPGVLSPGKMTDETIQEIESKNVRYLIWSNRIFPEYAALRFGTDFDPAVGTYLRAHYRRVGPLTPAPVVLPGWTAFIWERIPQGQP